MGMDSLGARLSGEVHIWSVKLDVGPELCARLRTLLDKPERDRMARLSPVADGRRFGVAHAALRLILATYGAGPPERLAFVANAFGKPSLAPRGRALSFSLSHAHGRALVAVAGGAEVGVDIERVGNMGDEAAVAALVFAPGELGQLQGLARARYTQRFYQLWTLKEAYLKARGEGFSRSPTEVEIDLGDARPSVRDARGGPRAAQSWRLCVLRPGGGYIGALAVERTGPEPEIVYRAPRAGEMQAAGLTAAELTTLFGVAGGRAY